MDLRLLKDWNGLRSGFRMVGVPSGQAELLIKRQIAVVAEKKTENKQNQKRPK